MGDLLERVKEVARWADERDRLKQKEKRLYERESRDFRKRNKGIETVSYRID